MKLRTKIICISCVTLFIAGIINLLIISLIQAHNFEHQAFNQAYQDSYEMLNQVELDLRYVNNDDSKNIEIEQMSYIFKQYKDNYNICYLVENNANVIYEIYNNTVITYDELSELEFYNFVQRNSYVEANDIEYVFMKREGRKYIVFHFVLRGGMNIYRIEDITYVQDEIVEMVLMMAGIFVIVTLSAVGILFLILRKTLQPLNVLNRTAMSIAEGFYDQRITIDRNDEIGQLAENFNKMAEAVEQRTDRLLQSEQRKTIFMGNLTHELKTPMTAISGYAQTMLLTKISEEDQREALTYIIDECDRLERLSRKMMNLLELSQNQELEFVDISAKKLFAAAKKSCEVILKNKNISLECKEHGEHFYMEPDLMINVIINLIDNGVKASEPGQKILLRAEKDCIIVQDFGKGIPKEEQEKILEPFYMIDKSRSRENGGAGLGLALVVSIAKRHNITISIDSEQEKGSRFILRFV